MQTPDATKVTVPPEIVHTAEEPVAIVRVTAFVDAPPEAVTRYAASPTFGEVGAVEVKVIT